MANIINLADICKGKSYQVSGFKETAAEYAEKLSKMGFVVGTAVALAPVKLNDPMVLQIRGSRVALRKSEAAQILVEEMSNA